MVQLSRYGYKATQSTRLPSMHEYLYMSSQLMGPALTVGAEMVYIYLAQRLIDQTKHKQAGPLLLNCNY